MDIEILNSYLGDSCFDPESFDVVVLLAVLEHAFDPLSIMEQVWKILKPGGWVIFSTPNLDNLPYHLMQNKSEYSWFVKEHINHFTLKTHRILLEKVGFNNPDFLMSGHFSIEENHQGKMLLPGVAFPRAARSLLANSLEPSAQKKFGKPSAELTDEDARPDRVTNPDLFPAHHLECAGFVLPDHEPGRGCGHERCHCGQ